MKNLNIDGLTSMTQIESKEVNGGSELSDGFLIVIGWIGETVKNIGKAHADIVAKNPIAFIS